MTRTDSQTKRNSYDSYNNDNVCNVCIFVINNPSWNIKVNPDINVTMHIVNIKFLIKIWC